MTTNFNQRVATSAISQSEGIGNKLRNNDEYQGTCAEIDGKI